MNIINRFLPKKYQIEVFEKNPQKSQTLVILHLFYPDMWPFFKESLSKIGDYDIVFTAQIEKKEEVLVSVKDEPYRDIVFCTNKGRDVLPFFNVAMKIDTSKYKSIIKLHTKKSPHFEDGDSWLSSILSSLTSITGEKAAAVFSEDTAILGPKNEYYSLVVNFEANGVDIDKQMRKLVGESKQHFVTQENRRSYGFFAGTMFWINPKYLSDIVTKLSPRHYDFDKEAGQIDGTYAHALERTLCIYAEAEELPVKSVIDGQIENVKYDSGIIPEWSDHYKE